MRVRILAQVAVLMLVATVALGATYGTIKVTVTDSDGAAIPGATVEATSPVFIGTRTATTDASGAALLTALVPGQYRVRVSLSGFQTATVSTKVSQNETVELSPKLSLASVAESITVTAEAPLVDTSRATVADEVTLEEVEALPVSRDYRGYAQLVSGVNVVPNQGGRDVPVDPASKGGNNYRDRTAEGRTGGTGSRDNQYYLDGLIITDIYSGEGSMSFNNEVILEQQVITSGIPAEFAGGKGFVGNIVTKSGGNEFSGSVNYYMMSPDFYSDFKSDDSRLHTSLEDKNDAAVTFGGPLMRDRAWFFLSGQMRENSDEVQLSTSASPNGGTEQYKNDRKNYFGKLTFKPSSATTIIGQYFADPRETSGSTDVNLPPARYDVIDSTPKTMWITGQHLFGGKFLLDGRVGRMKWDYFQGAGSEASGPRNDVLHDPADGSVANHARLLGGSSTAFTQIQKRDQIDLAGTYFLNAGGSHTLKGGVQFNKLQDLTESTFTHGMYFVSVAQKYSGIAWN
ncbi:MAG TPA: TonB-dependent receptor, partial [Thermoanaerobaculia bacterium]|nr:TonB-dependent receptor [Thermoanaerobaculia bacterium]